MKSFMFGSVLLSLAATGSAETPAMWQEKAMAAVIVAEAGGEGRAGMEAVAEVIVNRQRHFGWSFYKVISFHHRGVHHFSCLNKTPIDRLLAQSQKHPAFADALEIAKLVYTNPSQIPARVGRADHYTEKREKPWWAKDKVPTRIVGRHAFYALF